MQSDPDSRSLSRAASRKGRNPAGSEIILEVSCIEFNRFNDLFCNLSAAFLIAAGNPFQDDAYGAAGCVDRDRMQLFLVGLRQIGMIFGFKVRDDAFFDEAGIRRIVSCAEDEGSTLVVVFHEFQELKIQVAVFSWFLAVIFLDDACYIIEIFREIAVYQIGNIMVVKIERASGDVGGCGQFTDGDGIDVSAFFKKLVQGPGDGFFSFSLSSIHGITSFLIDKKCLSE